MCRRIRINYYIQKSRFLKTAFQYTLSIFYPYKLKIKQYIQSNYSKPQQNSKKTAPIQITTCPFDT
jgi:hypothetical protein